jgi:hypothetical protein
MLAEFADRFTSADSVFAEYRSRNGFRPVEPSDPREAVTDPTVCENLAGRIEAALQARTWEYWGTVSRRTYFMRLGPYYFVYVRGLVPAGSVGSGGYTYFMFDAVTLDELPLVYDFP